MLIAPQSVAQVLPKRTIDSPWLNRESWVRFLTFQSMYLEGETLLNFVCLDQSMVSLGVLYCRLYHTCIQIYLILLAVIHTDPEVFPLRKFIQYESLS